MLKLDNGLTFIHQEIPTTPVAVADIWVKAGASCESESCFGIAHFLEHMIFKGTLKVPPGVFDSSIENRGGVSNAATSYDYAHYTLTTAAAHIQDTLPLMAEMLLNATISSEEFIRERDVVLEEIRQSHDNPDWVAFMNLAASIYKHHPYGHPVLGSEAQVLMHSPEVMRCFHRTYYQPENISVVVVGGISAESALELVSSSFTNFSDRCNEFPQPQKPQSPIIAGIERQELHLPRLEQARLLMAWTGPDVQQLRNAYGLDLLSVILAQGRTSRLVRCLREEQQIVNSICSNFSLQIESSLFTISAWLEPENIEQVESLIRFYLQDMIDWGIEASELARAKRLMCNDYAFSTETPNQLAGLYGYYSTIMSAELSVNYPREIMSFELPELQKLAQQYLSPHNYAVTVVKPL